MVLPQLKALTKIALVTSAAIAVYEVTDQLLIYKYFRFEYYLLAAVLIALFTGFMIAKRSKAVGESPDKKGGFVKLTGKELDILKLIAEGKTNKEIAAFNFVEISTIKTHINNIYYKLGISNRQQAIDIYSRHSETYKSTLSPPTAI